ncbi:MAG: hypothetical protein ABI367_11000 [Mucilaginibacter sp.]
MEKPIKHLYFEVLEYLSNEGIGVDKNIKYICLPYANKSTEEDPPEDVPDAISKSWRPVMSVLGSLERQGYIKYSNEHRDLEQLYIVGGNFSASITKDGLDYYYIHVLRGATLKSLNNQWIFNFITWGIALLAVGTTIYTITQNTDLNKKVKQITEEVQQLKSLQHSTAATHKSPDTIHKTKQTAKR